MSAGAKPIKALELVLARLDVRIAEIESQRALLDANGQRVLDKALLLLQKKRREAEDKLQKRAERGLTD
jgi:hypothetical protein